MVEQRERTPFLFGWGADLSRQERESLKERIALFAGIGIAIVVAAILGYGVLYDNVIRPGQVAAANAKPIAVVGNYTITTGFFTRVEKFENQNITSNLQQAQNQLAPLQAQPKKNASQISQLEQQIAQLQQEQTNLASGVLNEIVDDQIAIQRGKTVGVPPTAKAKQAAVTQEEHAAGGPIHYRELIQSSGLSRPELEMLLLGTYLQGKIGPKVAAQVKRTQLEVRASHILVSTKNHALAVQLLHRVQHGANFAALARKYSIDKASAVKGGDLGYFPHGKNVAPFDKEAFSLKVGQVGLVKSQFGWHIIKVTGRKVTTLSPTDYQTAQANAYQSWLQKQKAYLRVQNIVPPANLPAVPTATALPGQVQTVPTAAVQIPTTTTQSPTAVTRPVTGTGKSKKP